MLTNPPLGPGEEIECPPRPASDTHAKGNGFNGNGSRDLDLKRKIEELQPHVWQARASVELVHDLNNPLTVVIGYAALVADEARLLADRDPDVSRKLLEYSAMVEKAADYCHHLSENWRLTAKKFAEFTRVDLVGVLQEVKQVIFCGSSAIRIGGVPEVFVRGSRFELMRIFQNLIRNAVEAGAGRVAVDVSIDGPQVTVTLVDNGPGMDLARVKRVLAGGFSSKANGTGLGLSICRHLIGSHGGTFALESSVGTGTTIRVTFPTAASFAGSAHPWGSPGTQADAPPSA